MINLKVLGFLGIAAGMTVSSIAVDAEATTLAARAGHAGTPSEANCFVGTWAQVANGGCGAGIRWFVVPVQFTASGVLTQFRASSTATPGSLGQPECRVVVTNNNNSGVLILGPAFISGTDINVGTSFAPTASQNVHYECALANPGAALTQVRW